MTLLIGVIIGLVLGLTGSGGSIFAVPLLVLLIDLPINDAIGIALAAVAVSALIGTILNWRYKSIVWVPAIILAAAGSAIAPFGKALGEILPPLLLQCSFSVLAIGIALRMWRQAVIHPAQTNVLRSGKVATEQFVEPVCRLSQSGQFEWKPRCVGSLLIGGACIGMLTGLLGVGGGFLIVPLLMYLSQISMQQAVGTSLIIITAVSASGFISYLAINPQLNISTLTLIAMGGCTGMLIGQQISHKISGPSLQKFFAACLILISTAALVPQLLS